MHRMNQRTPARKYPCGAHRTHVAHYNVLRLPYNKSGAPHALKTISHKQNTMTTELLAAVHKLNGYLLAISALKADGSSFSCFYLGQISLEDALAPLSISLRIEKDMLQFFPPDALTLSGHPTSFRQWLCSRWRLYEVHDTKEVDIRLFDGFVEEMNEQLGRPEQWMRAGAGPAYLPPHDLGAIWDVYLFSARGHAYAVHCSWDS